MGYPHGTTWVLEEGVWQPIFPGEAQGAGGTTNADPLQQYHTGWSIFADEGQEGAGSASSSQGPPQQQAAAAAAAGSGGPRGGPQSHQQHQQQQPYLPRQATARGAAPAATNHWNSGWSPTHQPLPQQVQPQQGRGYVVPAPGTWGYAATAAPSNGPWRDMPRSMTPTRTHGMKMKKTTHLYLRYKVTTTNRHGNGEQRGDSPNPTHSKRRGTASRDEEDNDRDSMYRNNSPAPQAVSPWQGARYKSRLSPGSNNKP